MNKPNKQKNNQVRYVPPDAALFEAIAEQVCSGQNVQDNSEDSTLSVTAGLSEFLTVVGNLTAKALTKGKAKWIESKKVQKFKGRFK